MTEPLLRIASVSKAYTGVQALDSVDFTLRRGQIHALMGVNGAGKSTLVRIIAGAERPDSGDMFLDGKKVRWGNVSDATHNGVVVVHQERILIRHLTVAENIMLGAEPASAGIISGGMLRRKALELVERFGVDLDVDANVNNLGAGEQQMVDIVRALRYNPKVLVLDEPTAALSAGEAEQLFNVLRGFQQRDVGIIFVSHRLDEIFEISTDLTILRDGKMVSEGTIADYTPEQVPRLMVGREIAETDTSHTTQTDAPILLETHDLCGPHYDNVSLRVPAGAVVGLAGMVGAGRTEFLESLIGFEEHTSGTITLRGEPVQINSPQEAIANGVVLIPDKRLDKGLMTRLSVLENLSVVSVHNHTRLGWVVGDALRETARQTIDKLGIVTAGLGTNIGSLSGGNKQKVVFGKWLAAIEDVEGKVFIFNEPTEGVDVGGRADMWVVIRDLAERGAGVIVSTSDMDELMRLSDYIYIMWHGHIVNEGVCATYTEDAVLHYMLGGAEPTA